MTNEVHLIIKPEHIGCGITWELIESAYEHAQRMFNKPKIEAIQLVSEWKKCFISQESVESNNYELVLGISIYIDTAESIKNRAILHNHEDESLPRDLSWSPGWKKPSDDPVRNLVNASVLIAAEIDRLQSKSNN